MKCTGTFCVLGELACKTAILLLSQPKWHFTKKEGCFHMVRESVCHSCTLLQVLKKKILFHNSFASLQISMQFIILKAKEYSFNYNYCKAMYIEDSIASPFALRRTHFSQAVETTISICGTWNQEHVR